MSHPLPEALRPFPVVSTIAVAWGDMDAFQHVNNAMYFRYFETARIAYFDRAQLDEATVGPILASTSCRFRAPVTYPDTLLVGARVTAVGTDRFGMEYAAYSMHLGRVAAQGEAVVVAYDYAARSKALVPQQWLDTIRALDPGAEFPDVSAS